MQHAPHHHGHHGHHHHHLHRPTIPPAAAAHTQPHFLPHRRTLSSPIVSFPSVHTRPSSFAPGPQPQHPQQPMVFPSTTNPTPTTPHHGAFFPSPPMSEISFPASMAQVAPPTGATLDVASTGSSGGPLRVATTGIAMAGTPFMPASAPVQPAFATSPLAQVTVASPASAVAGGGSHFFVPHPLHVDSSTTASSLYANPSTPVSHPVIAAAVTRHHRRASGDLAPQRRTSQRGSLDVWAPKASPEHAADMGMMFLGLHGENPPQSQGFIHAPATALVGVNTSTTLAPAPPTASTSPSSTFFVQLDSHPLGSGADPVHAAPTAAAPEMLDDPSAALFAAPAAPGDETLMGAFLGRASAAELLRRARVVHVVHG
ncbi:hypothetical protein HDU96_004932, partial [Phlyctochytrium bullatum]